MHFSADGNEEIIKINKAITEKSGNNCVKHLLHLWKLFIFLDLTCIFGSKTIKLGEGIEKEIEFYDGPSKASCECILPPFLTCKRA